MTLRALDEAEPPWDMHETNGSSPALRMPEKSIVVVEGNGRE